MTSTSAPGKLVIAGEFAVLDGHPALVVAVDRRVHARFTPGPERVFRGMGGGQVGDFALVHAVLDEAKKQGYVLPTGAIDVDSSALFVDGQKIGLGSSAAVASSVAAMVLKASNATPSIDTVFTLAFAAHHQFSGGKGSGVDVAAAVYGGYLRYQSNPPTVTPLQQFAADTLLCVQLGKPADTRDVLSHVQAFQNSNRAQYQNLINAIAHATDTIAAQLNTPAIGFDKLHTAVRAHLDAMRTLGENAGVAIVTEKMEEIARIAANHNASAKPSGAGGGDVALCFVPAQSRKDLQSALEAAGFCATALPLFAKGVL